MSFVRLKKCGEACSHLRSTNDLNILVPSTRACTVFSSVRGGHTLRHNLSVHERKGGAVERKRLDAPIPARVDRQAVERVDRPRSFDPPSRGVGGV